MSKPLVWSKYQEDVFHEVKHGSGHVCVSAVAGSGKSTALIEAVKCVPAKSGSVLITSFSTNCVEDLAKKEPPWTADLRTLNSLGNKAVVNHFGVKRIDKYRVDAVLDDIVGEAPKNLTSQQKSGFDDFRYGLNKLIGLAKTHLIFENDEGAVEHLYDLAEEFEVSTNPPDWMQLALQKKLACGAGGELPKIVFRALELCKKVNQTIDYDDQLWLPIVHDLKLEKFGWVFNDESQDTSPVQLELLIRALRANKPRMVAFGDDHQAIYRWRGAGAGMAPFRERLSAKDLPLSISYRCAKSIVRKAQLFVPHIEAHSKAPEGLVRNIGYEDMLNTMDIGDAILSRTNAPLLKLFFKLFAEGIPVGMQGRDAASGVISLVKQSGARSVRELQDFNDKWAKLEISRKQRRNPKADITSIEDRAGCIDALIDQSDSMQDVWRKIDSLVKPPPDQKVLLSTVHRGKGLEWRRVFLLEDTFPVNPRFWAKFTKNTVTPWCEERAEDVMLKEQEEKNIYYVAVTRAMRELYLVEGLKGLD